MVHAQPSRMVTCIHENWPRVRLVLIRRHTLNFPSCSPDDDCGIACSSSQHVNCNSANARPQVPWRHSVEGADRHKHTEADRHQGCGSGQCIEGKKTGEGRVCTSRSHKLTQGGRQKTRRSHPFFSARKNALSHVNISHLRV